MRTKSKNLATPTPLKIAKLLCDIFQVFGAVKNFFVFYENIL
jgi:hypothetical protein